ncbi:PDZ and LIM domain protein 2 isoform X1 [Agelaius phoeniceus]|uniref:PDZ and LIM domain protein 2 isoform X1 n=1 Tax=Agelaius phoeniceus TaxID=39638 RepID=UPI004054A71A
MGCPAPPGCAGMGGMGSGVDLGGAAAHSHPSHRSPGLRRSPGCHGDPVPPPGDPQRPSPLWICCRMKDWGCWSSLGVGRCCGAAEPVPRCHILPSKPHWLGSARPQRRPCCQGFTNFLPCSSSWERPWLSQLHRRVPGTPGEEAASPGGQEEEAVAADTLREPGSPPRKESAAGAGDPRGAAGTGRPSLCGLWVGGGGVPSASSPRLPGSLTPRSCPPRAAAAMPVTVTVTLPGPAPWGFRISGGRDFRKPITVSKVTEHGKAAAGDLRPGDVIVTINGESTAEMLNVEAQNKIKQSPGQLRLEVERSPVPYPSHTNGDASLEGLATRFQDTLQMPSESQSALRTLDPSVASLSASSQPLEQELTCPSLCQRRQPGEAKPVWEGAAPLPPARGTGVLAGQGPAARSAPAAVGHPGSGIGMRREWERDARGVSGCLLQPRAQCQDARGRPILPAGSRWLRAWRLPPFLPPCFLFFLFFKPKLGSAAAPSAALPSCLWPQPRPPLGSSGRPLPPSSPAPGLLCCRLRRVPPCPTGSIPAPEGPQGWGHEGAVPEPPPKALCPRGGEGMAALGSIPLFLASWKPPGMRPRPGSSRA